MISQFGCCCRQIVGACFSVPEKLSEHLHIGKTTDRTESILLRSWPSTSKTCTEFCKGAHISQWRSVPITSTPAGAIIDPTWIMRLKCGVGMMHIVDKDHKTQFSRDIEFSCLHHRANLAIRFTSPVNECQIESCSYKRLTTPRTYASSQAPSLLGFKRGVENSTQQLLLLLRTVRFQHPLLQQP